MRLTDLRVNVDLPTVNCIVVQESAMAAWWALAPDSKGSPLTPILDGLKPDLRTRSATDGMYRMPKDARNIFVSNMVKLWNEHPALGAAKSPTAAKAYIRTKLKSTLPV